MSVTMRFPSNLVDYGSYITFVRYIHEGYTTDKLRRPQDFQMKSSIGTSFGLPMPLAVSDGISISWNDESDQSLVGEMTKDAITKSRMASKALSEGSFRTGRAQERHTSMIFSGVSVKSHTFSWDLSPQTAAEAATIAKIIYQFREASLPNLTAGGELFEYPDLFKIAFAGKSKFTAMKFLPCVVSNIRIDYNPDGPFLAYVDGNVPRQILTVTFTEIASRNRQTEQSLR